MKVCDNDFLLKGRHLLFKFEKHPCKRAAYPILPTLGSSIQNLD